MTDFNTQTMFNLFLLKGQREFTIEVENILEANEPDMTLTDKDIDFEIDTLRNDMFNDSQFFIHFINSNENPKKKFILTEKGKLNHEVFGADHEKALEKLGHILIDLQGWKSIPPKTMTDFLKDFLESKGLAATGKLTPSQVDLLGVDEHKMVNKILKLFTDNKNNNLTYKNVFVKKINRIDNPKIRNQTISKDEIKQYISDIDSLSGTIKNALQPIRKVLISYEATNRTKITISANHIVGSLDLKELRNRDEIYKYWKDINEDYVIFTDSFEAFIDKIKILENENKTEVNAWPEPLKEIINNLKKHYVIKYIF